MAQQWYAVRKGGPAAAGAPDIFVNRHGVELPSVRPGSLFDVDPTSIATRGNVVLQQNGYTGWTVTRAPIQQPNGRYTVPLSKDVNGRMVYYENVVFDDVMFPARGGRRHRRRTTSRRRRTVTRRRHRA